MAQIGEQGPEEFWPGVGHYMFTASGSKVQWSDGLHWIRPTPTVPPSRRQRLGALISRFGAWVAG